MACDCQIPDFCWKVGFNLIEVYLIKESLHALYRGDNFTPETLHGIFRSYLRLFQVQFKIIWLISSTAFLILVLQLISMWFNIIKASNNSVSLIKNIDPYVLFMAGMGCSL